MSIDAPPLLDTSTLSEAIKQRDPRVARQARDHLVRFGRFSFSIITRFEILRGLFAKNATRQIRNFQEQCVISDVLPLTDDAVVKAAELYAELRKRGEPIDDADLLIAGTALVNGRSLVTENIEHFRRIPDLRLESWRSS